MLGVITWMTGPWQGQRHCLIFSTGLAFVPGAPTALSRLAAGNDDDELIARLSQVRLDQLVDDPEVLWVTRDEIAAARVTGITTTAIDLSLHDGTLLVIRATGGTVETDPANDDLEEALRGKLRRGDWEGTSTQRAAVARPGFRWALRDGFALMVPLLVFASVITALIASDELSIYRALSVPGQVIRVEATVESPPDDSGLVVLSVREPRLPDSVEISEDVLAEPSSLSRGDHLVLLLNPADPENQVIEEGLPISTARALRWAGIAAGLALAAVGCALNARRRYLAIYGRPAQRPQREELKDA